MNKKPLYTLHNDDLVEHIYHTQDLRGEIHKFFIFSPLWRAITSHVADGRGKSVLIDPPSGWEEPKIRSYRGTGYSISFRNAAIYGLRGESPHVEVQVEIEWGEDCDTFTKNHTLHVPIELARSYTEEGFHRWVEVVRENKAKALQARDKKAVQGLLERYPQYGTLTELHQALGAEGLL